MKPNRSAIPKLKAPSAISGSRSMTLSQSPSKSTSDPSPAPGQTGVDDREQKSGMASVYAVR